jgi:hypothetical protein
MSIAPKRIRHFENDHDGCNQCGHLWSEHTEVGPEIEGQATTKCPHPPVYVPEKGGER